MQQMSIDNIKTKTKDIDGYKISVTPFGAKIGLPLKFRLTKVLSPALSGLQADANIFAMFERVFENSNPDELFKVVFDSLANTSINGQNLSDDVIFNNFFASNYDLLYKVFAFVLEVNYNSFFKLLGFGMDQIVSAQNKTEG